MKNPASKVYANRSSKRSHALKDLLEKQEANLLELREDLPFEVSDHSFNIKTVQFSSDAPALLTESVANLSAAIGIFHELITKEITCAAVALEINEQELKAWVDL